MEFTGSTLLLIYHTVSLTHYLIENATCIYMTMRQFRSGSLNDSYKAKRVMYRSMQQQHGRSNIHVQKVSNRFSSRHPNTWVIHRHTLCLHDHHKWHKHGTNRASCVKGSSCHSNLHVCTFTLYMYIYVFIYIYYQPTCPSTRPPS